MLNFDTVLSVRSLLQCSITGQLLYLQDGVLQLVCGYLGNIQKLAASSSLQIQVRVQESCHLGSNRVALCCRNLGILHC